MILRMIIAFKKTNSFYRYLFCASFLILFFIIAELQACTIFNIKTAGSVLVGRNFDWHIKGGRLWFIPPGNGKLGFCVLEQLGINMPYEGMNEKGLFVGMAAVPDTEPPISTSKPKIKSLTLMKIILEHSTDLEEALSYFSKYTIQFGKSFGFPVLHYMVVDQNGNSAIIEFVNQKKIILKKPGVYQVLTNHFLSVKNPDNAPGNSMFRYNFVDSALKAANASPVKIKDVMFILNKVTQPDNSKKVVTVWSTAYNLNNLKIYQRLRKGTEQYIEYDLHKEMNKGKHSYILE